MSSLSSVESIFNDKFMGLVSIAIVPFFLAELFATGSERVTLLAEAIIVAVFGLEYISKLAVAKDKGEFVKDKWQILNLIIILSFFVGIIISFLLAVAAIPTTILRLLRLLRLALFVTRAAGALEFHRWLLRTGFYHIVIVSIAVIFVASYAFLLVEPRASSALGQLMPQTALGVGLAATTGLTILVIVGYTVSRMTDSFKDSDNEVESIRQELHRLDTEIRKRPIPKKG